MCFYITWSHNSEILLDCKTIHKILVNTIPLFSISQHTGPSPTELCSQKAEWTALLFKCSLDNMNADISSVLKKRPNYSTSEYNRKYTIKSLFCVQSKIKTKQSLREKMKKWNRNKTTD